ncbi:MAG: hypothetical protein JRN19_06600 [Nitrososphaerota archaeon]|nr:hypothetical protein [Nitrososphaerota archaeon]MDG7049330.1 hypothetical protein [Nitrososphaerota archaeon]MDG7052101.1 hypothetical protein [Nitrososphaerota archaeon]
MFDTRPEGEINYSITEEALELSPIFTEIYPKGMTEAPALEKNYLGQPMGCGIHRRFDPLVRLVCPTCKSSFIKQVGERVCKCTKCGKTFSYPQIEHCCKENHAFGLDISINQSKNLFI